MHIRVLKSCQFKGTRVWSHQSHFVQTGCALYQAQMTKLCESGIPIQVLRFYQQCGDMKIWFLQWRSHLMEHVLPPARTTGPFGRGTQVLDLNFSHLLEGTRMRCCLLSSLLTDSTLLLDRRTRPCECGMQFLDMKLLHHFKGMNIGFRH